VPVQLLERLDAHLRENPTVAGAVTLTPEAQADLGWDESTARTVLRALDFTQARKTTPGAPSLWRVRRDKADASKPKAQASPGPSPFAALAALQTPPSRRRRPRKPRRVPALKA
jgi:hypothetical protein